MEDQETQLNIIESNHAGDSKKCCMDMFRYWLIANTDASWQQLVEALRSPAVKLPVVAADIEKMLTGSYLANTVEPLLKLKDIPNKGHLSIKDKLCGPYRAILPLKEDNLFIIRSKIR